MSVSPTKQTLTISPSQIPDSHNKAFLSSSFFKKEPTTRQLPTPEQVRARAALQQPPYTYPPEPVVFSELNLLVKYGRKTSLNEGQCLWMVRTYLGDQVPVPEVYGWREDNEEVFIYMELVLGSTLEQSWDRLSDTERFDLCDQLRPMVSALRQINQAPGESCVGSVTFGPLQDIIFEGSRVGPFPDISNFNDFFAQAIWDDSPAGQIPDDDHPMRPGIPPDPISFTHTDLHRSNIMISLEGQRPRILAIIDWHQSGWYPVYWEYCKARWTVEPGDEWVSKYLPKILEPRPEVYHSWDYFCLCNGV